MKAVYELKLIKDSRDNNLTRALSIYSQNIEPILRTDTREIIYWLDNYNKTFKDRFYLLGLNLNNKLIGFAQLVYFIEEQLVFVDYIVIDNDHRKNNTFYQFLEEIKVFLNDMNIYYMYILGEVGYYSDKKSPTEKTRSLIRLLKMSGFGVIKADYYQPMLGKNNYESELMSVLMLCTPDELKRIKKDTFIMMITTVYYKHYKRWYDTFFNEVEQADYIGGLNRLISIMNEKIKKRDFIEINGYAHILNPGTIQTSSNPSLKILHVLGVLILFIITTVAVGLGVYFLKKKFDIDSTSLTFICISSIVFLLFIFYAFFKNKNQPLASVIEKIIGVFK